MGRSDSGEGNINFRVFKLFKTFAFRLIKKKNDISSVPGGMNVDPVKYV